MSIYSVSFETYTHCIIIYIWFTYILISLFYNVEVVSMSIMYVPLVLDMISRHAPKPMLQNFSNIA